MKPKVEHEICESLNVIEVNETAKVIFPCSLEKDHEGKHHVDIDWSDCK